MATTTNLNTLKINYLTQAQYNGALNNNNINENEIYITPDTTVIPTKVSDLTNDAGYLTSYTETDPTVPAWAKAANKPTYTASEVGAAASNHSHTLISSASVDYETAISTSNNLISMYVDSEAAMKRNVAFQATCTDTTIDNIVTPTTDRMAANKKYVDDAVSGIIVPTAVSSLTNDSGYQNSTQVQSAINTAIGNINSFEVAVVSALPTSGIQDHTIYFVPQAVNSSTHNEYMYINNTWELIGTTTVDLSGYLQSSDIADWAKAANKPSYTAQEVGALPSTYTAPVTSVNGQTGAVSLTIPTVPTNVSDFTNDAGYLTSYTETDPTVPAWAKAANKPTYTATEVGAIATTHAAATITSTDISNWNAKSDFTGSYDDLEDKPTIPTVPTNVSAFTNDSGYLTLATLPIYDGTVQNG